MLFVVGEGTKNVDVILSIMCFAHGFIPDTVRTLSKERFTIWITKTGSEPNYHANIWHETRDIINKCANLLHRQHCGTKPNTFKSQCLQNWFNMLSVNPMLGQWWKRCIYTVALDVGWKSLKRNKEHTTKNISILWLII